MRTPPSEELIDESRRRLNIPDDWGHVMCAALCGELVWYPPGVIELARDAGKPLAVFCSNECTVSYLAGRSAANCPTCGGIPGRHEPGCAST